MSLLSADTSFVPVQAGAWKSDMRKFRDQLSRYGLRIKEMDPDGNCMFRAIADQLWGAPERHGEVRAVSGATAACPGLS